MKPGDFFRVKPDLKNSDETAVYGLNIRMLGLAGTILIVADVVDIIGHRGYQDKEHGEYWDEEWVIELEDITVVKTDIVPVS